jgi:penicillin-binding protein 1A
MGGGFLYLQIRILKHLPDVSQIKDIQLTQATVITDRNGVELYKIFDENREYVTFENISKHMVDAIVAVEDQRYWEHEGLDPMGIFRAGFMTMIGRN